MLWADWGIYHLHITDVELSSTEFFSSRKCSDGENWLLFCFFLPGQSFFVDVRKHDESAFIFSDRALLEIIYHSWPLYMDRFKLKGILVTQRNQKLSCNEVKMLREIGMATWFEYDGHVFHSPGGGVTGASTSLSVGVYADKLRFLVRELIPAISPNGFIYRQAKTIGVEDPYFELSFTPKGLMFVEISKNIGFQFCGGAKDSFSVRMEELQNLFLPNWALASLLPKF